MDETPAAGFVMQGARDAIALGLNHIERQVEELEKAVIVNPGLAFDLSRALVESTCRTVLKEREIPYSHSDELPKLFKTVRENLPVLPPASSDATQVGRSLKQTLNGLNTAIHGICELRNQCGFASHGFEEEPPVMEDVQALMIARSADVIIGFLYRIHSQGRSPTFSYETNTAFNDSFDEANGPIQFSDVEFRASEVLHAMEPETYRIYLAEFNSDSDTQDTSMASEERVP